MAEQLSKVTPTGSWNESVKAGTTAPLARKLMGAQNPTVGFGGQIAKFGGGIAAAAGLMDAVQYAFAAIRVSHQRDKYAVRAYSAASILAGISSYYGIVSSFVGSTFLGPVGLSILLGLAAYAIAKQAKQQESSPLEQWARQCRWGTPTKQREWKDHEELDAAISCLNLAILGVTAHIAITANFKTIPSSRLISIGETYSIPSSRLLTYKISTPNFSRDNSRYEWILTTYKPNNKTPSDCYRGSNDDLTHDDNPDVAQTPSSRRTLIIEDSIALEEYDNIHAAELILIYWPDKFDSSGYARLQVKHDKLDLMEN